MRKGKHGIRGQGQKFALDGVAREVVYKKEKKRLKQETIKKRKGKISQRNLLFMLLSNPRIAVVRRIRALLHPLFSYLEQCV